MKLNHKPPHIPFVRKLCAHLTEEEIEAAEVRFMEYLALCREAAEIIAKDKKEREAFWEAFDKFKNGS